MRRVQDRKIWRTIEEGYVSEGAQCSGCLKKAANEIGELEDKMTMGSRGAVPTEDAMTAFSALHLLRNYNQLFTPTGNTFIPGYNPYSVGTVEVHHVRRDNLFPCEWPPILGSFQPYLSASPTPMLPESKGKMLLPPTRRPRGEKKPIPDEQKDDRYYERRKRNNQAAKKSRDARKLREDQIALRATLLEHENAVLRAQVLALREELQSLRQLVLIQGKVQMRALTGSSGEDYKLLGLNEFYKKTEDSKTRGEGLS